MPASTYKGPKSKKPKTKRSKAAIKAIARHTLALMTSAAFFTAPAFAAELKESIRVAGEKVYASDIFEGIESGQDVEVMKAPKPGDSRSLSIYQIEAIAHEAGIDFEKPGYLARIEIERLGTPVSENDIAHMLEREAILAGAPEQIAVRVFGNLRSIKLPVGLAVDAIQVEGFSLTNGTSRFTATLAIPFAENQYDQVILTGTIEEMTSVPVFARPVIPGDIITDKDIEWKEISVRRVRQTVVRGARELVGQTVRRPLNTGQPINSNDIMRPIAIEKGHHVTMRYDHGALQLTATGRALENGGTGDVIRLMNIKTKLTVEARVLSPDTVEISPFGGSRLASR